MASFSIHIERFYKTYSPFYLLCCRNPIILIYIENAADNLNYWDIP